MLDVALNDVGVPSLGLWAQVPHYVSGMPYPGRGRLTLLEGLHEIAGLTIPTGQLPSDAKATRIRLDELVAQNPQHQAMVTQLEEMADQGLGGPESEVPIFGFDRIPSGDELAAELQEFLRQHPDESSSGPARGSRPARPSDRVGASDDGRQRFERGQAVPSGSSV